MAAVRYHGQPLVDDPARLQNVGAVGVDETAFTAAATSPTEFVTGIVDLTRRRGGVARLLDVVEGRSAEALQRRYPASRDRRSSPRWGCRGPHAGAGGVVVGEARPVGRVVAATFLVEVLASFDMAQRAFTEQRDPRADAAEPSTSSAARCTVIQAERPVGRRTGRRVAPLPYRATPARPAPHGGSSRPAPTAAVALLKQAVDAGHTHLGGLLADRLAARGAVDALHRLAAADDTDAAVALVTLLATRKDVAGLRELADGDGSATAWRAAELGRWTGRGPSRNHDRSAW
jgi:hypothetical protein